MQYGHHQQLALHFEVYVGRQAKGVSMLTASKVVLADKQLGDIK